MKYLFIVLAVAVLLPLRLWLRRRRHRQRSPRDMTDARGRPGRRWSQAAEAALGDVGLVAWREIRERVRGRIFRVGTLLILAVVAAAIVIPAVHSGGGPTVQVVGVVGPLPAGIRQLVDQAGTQNHDVVRFVGERTAAAAKADLRSGRVSFSILDGAEVLLKEPATASNSPADPDLVGDVADALGVIRAYRAAGLTALQAETVDHAKPVPVRALRPSPRSSIQTLSIVGLVLVFFMLSQYCTWILIGVMQEKASRVVEVLLATLRPIELLGGKVLGIGLVALGQAAVVVGFAFALAESVGSDLLKGAAPTVLLCELLWLVLGYAFYCWVYAAAGSTAERQDQVQTLALPLSIPILIGYIFSITVASSGNPDAFFDVLAYVPLTAPFCMPVLVGLHDVSWWQFVASVLITVVATVGTAVFAARIYRRAVLRTGARVRIRGLVTGTIR